MLRPSFPAAATKSWLSSRSAASTLLNACAVLLFHPVPLQLLLVTLKSMAFAYSIAWIASID